MASAASRQGLRVVFPRQREVAVEQYEAQAPGEGQLLVRTLATTISTGTELTILSGEFPPESRWADYARYPFVAGYSNCGEIIEIGPGAEGYAVGERVVSYAPHAEYALLTPEDVFGRVPDEVSDEEASTFTLGLIALNGIRRAQLQLGESVVVYGLGLLGLLTAQLARLNGCRPLIGVDLSEQRRAWARELGADVVVDGTENVPEAVSKATDEGMADVLFEVTGKPAIIESEFRVLRRFGRAVILSSPRGPSSFDFHDFCNSPSITIIGAHNGSTVQCETVHSQWTWPRHCQLYMRLMASGELRVKEMISHRFAPAEAPEVYRWLLEDRSGAGFVVFNWAQ